MASIKENKALFQAEVIHRKSGQPVCKPVRIITVLAIHRAHPADLVDLFLLSYRMLQICLQNRSRYP